MKNEDGHDPSRREATGKLVRILALATGLSALELQSLLAQSTYQPRKPVRPQPSAPTKTTPRPTTQVDAARQLIVSQKSPNQQLAELKVLLENSPSVFENEFGRITPIVTTPAEHLFDRGTLPPDMMGQMMNVCGANFDPSGYSDLGQAGLSWCNGTNTCTGQQLTGTDPDGEGCSGTNSCNGQTCSKQQMCEDNTCSGQTCPDFKICQPKNNESLVSADMLTQLGSNLYVQLLFKEFQVDNAAALANAINATLASIAAGETEGWPPR